MNIRTRLAIRFTLMVATLAVIFTSSIYYFSATYRQKEFYARLKEKAKNYSQLIIQLGDKNSDLVKVYDRNTAYLPNEHIVIIGKDNRQLFNTYEGSNIEPGLIEKIRSEKEIKYTENYNEVLALVYPGTGEDLVVIVSAYDQDGMNKLDNLRLVLIVGFIIFSIVTMLLGWFFSAQALKPISGVIRQVEKITASNLAQRVDEGNGKDEIALLAVTFNHMLERIHKAFELQKSFVSNSSHELRTPLTSITGQLEVALMSTRDPEEYKAVLLSLLDDIKSVNRLTNGLLELAQADLDISKLRVKKVRIDELLLVTRNDLLKRYPDYKINIDLQEFPEEETRLLVLGSEHLLRSVFINIMDNACKFSPDKTVNIQFKTKPGQIELSFKDKGIGIPTDDLGKISQPFYRGSNAKGIAGHGLGLSLTYKVVDIHGARMQIESQLNEYTTVTVLFKTA